MSNTETIIVGFAIVAVVITFIVGRKSGHRRGFNAGHEKGKQDQLAVDRAQVAGLQAVRLRDEWMAKPCEMEMPAEDFQALWNTDKYNGGTELKGIVRLNLRRASGVTFEFKDCEHKSLSLASFAEMAEGK